MVGRQGPPRAKTLLTTGVFAQRRPLLDEPHDTAACSVPRAGRQTASWPRSDREQASSDGGAVLLKAAERVYDLVKGFARCLVDKRAPESDSAHARRPDRPAGLRHRVRPSGRERCRPPRRGSHPQAAAGAGPGHRRAPGVATRRCRRFENGVGRGALYRMARELAESVIERHRQRRQGRARHHDRSGPDRRPDARGATARLLQRVLRHVVLSAAAGVRDVRPRSGCSTSVRRCCGPARR